jgi:hypothetical protein
MYNLAPSIVREKLLSLVGEKEYRKFVAALNGRCNTKGRMFFWQETMWDSVQKQLGVHIEDFRTIQSFFQHCHVHGNDLEHDVVPIQYGTWKFSGKFVEAQETLFPHANDVVYGPCCEEPPRAREVFFCRECRTAKKRWAANGT